MLDFTLDQEQEMLATIIGRFAEERVRPVFREAEERGAVPAEVIQAGWELGLLPTSLPAAYGGLGDYSVVTAAIAVEAFAWGDLATTFQILAPNLVAVPLLLEGSQAQQTRYLPDFTTARRPPAVTAALIEPGIRFNPRALKATATIEGDGYRLNGAKTMVPLAEDAELLLVYAAEAGETQAFLVPGDAEGLTVGPEAEVMGLGALPLYRLHLENVYVPAVDRLGGEEGSDFARLLNHSRVALAAAAVGVARAGYEYAREYAKQRVQFGEPIAHRQSIAFMLAEMAIDIEAARLLVWEAAWKLDRGEEITREATVMKHYVDDVVLQTADRAVQILGGYGYIREYPVELWLRNARGFVHFDGLAIV
ncbi:MAG: acyl-CoA dehydrogenase family protein [Candidatus Promineifilaceae bacterium]|nr:acyl-CoA dehydrogenase family protein [Candidatus Promineifilaceae bacterium]